MSAKIQIAGVDRTLNVDPATFNLSRAITNQIDTAKMDVIRKGGAASGGYKPALLDIVVISEDSEVGELLLENGGHLLCENGVFIQRDNAMIMFGGQIVELDAVVQDASDIERFTITAKDYSYDMDKTLVIGTYQSMTVGAIIASMQASFFPTYNIANVSCTLIANYVSFNYEYPSKCLQQLADLVNYDWYVDSQKKIYFFQKGTQSAPFALTDTSANYYYNSLVLKDNLMNLRNSVIVRGGQYLGTTVGEIQVADGQQKIFTQGYQYNTVYVKVNGVTKTVGIDNIDDPLLFDCLYNFQEKFVRFPAAVTATQTVEVGGLPYIPVIVKVRDTASIALYGEHQYKIVDKSINSKEGARDRALAELTAWSTTINEGSFQTTTGGLDTGQQIAISSTIRGMSDTYVISRISTTMTSGQDLLHSVTLVTTKTYGMIEFLMQLLINKDKEIEINAGEVTDAVESASEVITMVETTPVVSISHNPQTEALALAESSTVQALGYAVIFAPILDERPLQENSGLFLQEVAGGADAYPLWDEQAFDYPIGFARAFVLDGSPLA